MVWYCRKCCEELDDCEQDNHDEKCEKIFE